MIDKSEIVYYEARSSLSSLPWTMGNEVEARWFMASVSSIVCVLVLVCELEWWVSE